MKTQRVLSYHAPTIHDIAEWMDSLIGEPIPKEKPTVFVNRIESFRVLGDTPPYAIIVIVEAYV